MKRLPGAEIVLPGIADLEAGRKKLGNAAHAHYNAMLRRIISFARAAEHAQRVD